MIEYMAAQLENLNVPYEFGAWTDTPIPAVYFTGEFEETEADPETQQMIGRFTLAGHSYDGRLLLDAYCSSLQAHFGGGVRVADEDGGKAVWYAGSQYVPTQLEGLDRIEIYFTTMEWR
jgi:hypothetical protein